MEPRHFGKQEPARDRVTSLGNREPGEPERHRNKPPHVLHRAVADSFEGVGDPPGNGEILQPEVDPGEGQPCQLARTSHRFFGFHQNADPAPPSAEAEDLLHLLHLPYHGHQNFVGPGSDSLADFRLGPRPHRVDAANDPLGRGRADTGKIRHRVAADLRVVASLPLGLAHALPIHHETVHAGGVGGHHERRVGGKHKEVQHGLFEPPYLRMLAR